MTQAQDWFSKNMKRKSTSYDQSTSSLVSESTASSRTNLSESSKQTDVLLGCSQVFPTKTPSLPHDSNAFSPEKLQLPISSTFDIGKTQSEFTLTSQNNLPQEKDEMLSFSKTSKNCGLAGPSSVIPDSISQTAQDSQDGQIIMPPNNSLTPPGSESPQLDQLLSDLEEMKLKYRSEMLDPPLLDSNDDHSPEDHCPPEDGNVLQVNVSSVVQLTEDNNHTNVAVIPGEHQTNLLGEDSTTDPLQSQEELKSAISSNDLSGATEEISTESMQDQHPHLGKANSVETPQSEDYSSQSFSNSTPDTVISASNLSFEEIMLLPSQGKLETSSDDYRPRTSGQLLEESLTPVDSECFVSQPISVQSKAEITLSSSDEEYNIPPGYAKTSSTTNNYTGKFSSESIAKEPEKSRSEIPEGNLTNLLDEDSTTDIQQSQEELESAVSPNFSDATEGISTESIQDQHPHLGKATSVETTQSEDLSSQSLSDLTPDTVMSASNFSFEELMPFPSLGILETSSDEDRPMTYGQLSEDSLTPVDSECFVSQPISVQSKAEITLSPSDEEYDIPPGYAKTTSTTTCYSEKCSSVSLPEVSAKSLPEIPEEHQTSVLKENSTSDILQSQELESIISSNDLRGVTEEISTQIIQDQLPHLGEPTSVETTQGEDFFSQSFCDLTPDTVARARHFGFEEMIPLPSPGNLETSSDEDRPMTYGQLSEDSLSPVDSEYFVSQPLSVQPKADITSSPSDEEYDIPPGYAKTTSTTTCYTEKFSSVSLPEVSAKSLPEIPEEHQTIPLKENDKTDILQSQEELESIISSNDLRSATEEISTQIVQDQLPHLGEPTSVETTQGDNTFSQSFSDLTPDTVARARHFGFEELITLPSPGNLETSSDEDRPMTYGQLSEDSLSPVDSEYFVSQPLSVQPKADITSSPSDEEYDIPPGYAKTTSTTTCYTEKFSSVSLPEVSAKSLPEIPEEHQTIPLKENDKTDILQSQEELESIISSNDLRSATEEISTQIVQDQLPHLGEPTSVETTQGVNTFSQSFSDLTPDTVARARHFGFEELIPLPSPGNLETSSDEDRPMTYGQLSEDSLSPVDSEYFVSQPLSVQPKAEITSSPSDEEYDIPPGYANTTSTTTCYTEKFSSASLPEVSTKSLPEIPEEHQTSVLKENSMTDILQSQEELESAISSNDLSGATEEISTQIVQDQLPHLGEPTSVETTQGDNTFSPSFSDLTPDTVACAKYFGFEELIALPSPGNLETSSDDDRPMTYGQLSENSLTPVDSEYFVPQPISVQPKAEMTLSTSDEEYNIPPGYAKTISPTNYTDMPPEYAKVVHSGAGSPTCEYYDPDAFFDCKQAASDFSETDEPDTNIWSSGDQPQEKLSHSRVLQKVNRRVLLSSGSEDYEDAPFVQEPLHNVHEENGELLDLSEASDDEFTLCEASQPPPVPKIGAYGETDAFLTREITAELGSMSESSDDEFLTTRIVRRRVVIQADEMPDLPSQSVTEEKYEDENGHLVVKKVTRKIIRKCISADGVEREEVSLEGAPQGSISMAEGDGYSKVVKRTVLKSEGDHTEVTFAEYEGFSASNQETAEGGKVRHVERTTVVEGERTMTHQGDPSLASDLPTAKDDFKQALGYISGFSRTELPHVVERETVKEDGTVVRRAHMRKGRTLRRTVVKGAGQRKQVLVEQVDNPRKGSKPNDLKQHLHQLFHRYYEEERENTDEDEKEEEE
uniref:serine-rich adhesin for platelets isoform X1 n=2 Tax=Semicossyphus pulcher TaxID=241346 RepID=UPI0037E96719